jgi:hypothetical protein
MAHLFLHCPRIPLEHFREEKLTKAGISFGLGHEAQEFIGVVQKGVLDAAIELIAPQVINVACFEGGPQSIIFFQLLLDQKNAS